MFTIFNPFLAGLEKIKFGLQEIPVKENYYIVKLDSSRHSQSDKPFIVEMNEYGKMIELDFLHSTLSVPKGMDLQKVADNIEIYF